MTAKPMVLVVDDDADTRDNLVDILELDEYPVQALGTAAELFAFSDWPAVFAVLLDRMLPDGRAEDLLPTLRRLAPDVAVVVITGYADLETATCAMRRGAADYVLKPIEPDLLRATLARLWEHKLARDEVAMLARFPDENLSPVLRIDAAGRIQYANRSSQPLLNAWRVDLGAELPEPWRTIGGGCLTTGNIRDVEFQSRDHVFSLRFTPVCEADYVNIYGYDVTTLKRIEKELRDERNFAESLIETAQAIVLVLDPQGRIVQYNPFTEELTGVPLAEAKGRDWFENFLPQRDRHRIRNLFQDFLNGKEVRGNVNPIITRLGRERRISWRAKMLMDSDGKVVGVLATGHDVTDLEEAQRRVVQSERLSAVGEAMTALAHESRNALQRSQACLEMLAKRVKDRPKAVELVERIQRAQDYLTQLYEEVREFAAPIQLRLESCAVAQLAQDAWNELRLLERFRLHSECTDGVIELDRRRIQQVFRNLFENSLASGGAGVRVIVACRDAQVGKQEGIRISVRDNGPGFPPDIREKVFDSFFTTRTQGTGLGLAICRRIVELHGGTIALGDAEVGAEVVLFLPRKPS